MVKGETGTLSLDVRTSVDKGVSIFVCVFVFVKTAWGAVLNIRSQIWFPFSLFLWVFIAFSFIIQVLFPCFLWGDFLLVLVCFLFFKYKLSFFLSVFTIIFINFVRLCVSHRGEWCSWRMNTSTPSSMRHRSGLSDRFQLNRITWSVRF